MYTFLETFMLRNRVLEIAACVIISSVKGRVKERFSNPQGSAVRKPCDHDCLRELSLSTWL